MTRLAGGASGIAATALESDRIVLDAELLPGGDTLEAEAALRALRKKKKVSAILHEGYPVRFWDHDLGPASRTCSRSTSTTSSTRSPPSRSNPTRRRPTRRRRRAERPARRTPRPCRGRAT